jgi:hypothetical protein
MTWQPINWGLLVQGEGAPKIELGRGVTVHHPDWGVGKIIGAVIWEDTYCVVAHGWRVDFGDGVVMACFERSLRPLQVEGEFH